jgi:hypothetical protein
MFTINEITNAEGNIGWAIIKDKTSIVKEFTSIEAACAYLDAVEDGEAKPVALKNVKPGDYVKRKADAVKVYIKGDYDRMTKSFELKDVEDINRVIYIKATKPVYVGFTY